MIVCAYVRVSTAEQAKEGYSIGEQTERLQKYCEAHGWKIYNIYTDAGYSGAKKDRPALQQLVKDAKDGRFQKVVVYKLDRLSRSQKDTLSLIENDFLGNNIGFVSMLENFDTSTPFGRAMVGILAVFAQLEREQIKERVGMGREARAKAGYYTGNGEPPYGYNYKGNLLIVNEYEAMGVQRMFELAKEGKAPWSIAKIMEEEGLYKPRHDHWKSNSIRQNLTSRIYVGEVSYSKKWYKGVHEPLISYDDFENVQELIENRKRIPNKSWKNNGKATSLLAGFIVCGKCGRHYYKQVHKSSKNCKIIYVPYYKCHNSIFFREDNADKCLNKYWKMEELDDQIISEIRKLSLDSKYFKMLRKSDPELDKTNSMRKAIAKVEGQISKLMDLYSIDEFPIDMISKKIKALDAQKKNLEKQLVIESGKIKSSRRKESIEKIIGDIPTILDEGTIEDKRKLLSCLIDKIVVNDDDIAIFWMF